MKLNAFLFLFLLGLLSCQEPSEAIKPKVMEITESVYASATIMPSHAYRVFAAAPGLLQKLNVEESDLVKEGDVLAIIENKTSDLSKQQAAVQLRFARDQINGPNSPLLEWQQKLALAKEQYQQDSIDFATRQRLWNQNIGSKQQYDQAMLRAKQSLTNYQNAKAQYNQVKSKLETDIDLAEKSYSISREQAANYTVTSREAGRVYALYKEVGEQVSLQEPIALLGDAEAFIIEMEVDEQDIVRVTKGLEVMVTLDSYPDTVFTASVSKIYPIMNKQTQTFLVEAQFTAKPPVLYPNLSAEANIIIQKKSNALVIPKRYLLPGPAVQTQGGKRMAVTTGIESLDKVEIRSGIDSTTLLVNPE